MSGFPELRRLFCSVSVPGQLHTSWVQGIIEMGAMILTLALTSILLIIGIVGTVIGITRLVYPSGGRHHRPIRQDRDITGR
jgi:hypothetical protein